MDRINGTNNALELNGASGGANSTSGNLNSPNPMPGHSASNDTTTSENTSALSTTATDNGDGTDIEDIARDTDTENEDVAGGSASNKDVNADKHNEEDTENDEDLDEGEQDEDHPPQAHDIGNHEGYIDGNLNQADVEDLDVHEEDGLVNFEEVAVFEPEVVEPVHVIDFSGDTIVVAAPSAMLARRVTIDEAINSALANLPMHILNRLSDPETISRVIDVMFVQVNYPCALANSPSLTRAYHDKLHFHRLIYEPLVSSVAQLSRIAESVAREETARLENLLRDNTRFFSVSAGELIGRSRNTVGALNLTGRDLNPASNPNRENIPEVVDHCVGTEPLSAESVGVQTLATNDSGLECSTRPVGDSDPMPVIFGVSLLACVLAVVIIVYLRR